jgi:tetratricopeptide (TPR) repeat protein
MSLSDELERLYHNLDRVLPSPPGNPCGRCRECCTAAGLTQHRVSQLELDYIAERAGPEKVEDFRRYAAREPGASPLCPYYELETARCGIYRFRPFSCRIFGHFRAEGTHLPAGCVFAGQETVFPRRSYLQVVPLARELRDLLREHLGLRPPGHGRYMEAGSARLSPEQGEFFDPEDPLDRALLFQVAGQPERALEELLGALEQRGRTPYMLYSLGIVYEQMGRPREALEVFREASDQVPEAAAYHYHVGYNCLELGDREAAFEAFARTARLDAGHSLALGLMGYLKVIEGQLEAGAELLQQAVQADPANGTFRLRLGLTWLGLGRVSEGLAQIRAASHTPMAAETAREILESLGQGLA